MDADGDCNRHCPEKADCPHSAIKNDEACFVRVCNRVSFAAFDTEYGRTWFHRQNKAVHAPFVIAGEKIRSSNGDKQSKVGLIGLTEIHRFCAKLQEEAIQMQGQVVTTWAGENIEITDGAMLIGCFCIMFHEGTPDKMRAAFHPISHRFIQYKDDVTVMDCWSALFRAKTTCGWLDFKSDFWLRTHRQWARQDELDPPNSKSTLDMEECAHYHSPANGRLHFVIPDKLIIFDCPDNLPDRAAWTDADGMRRFSATFYGNLFTELGVDAVVRCGGYGCSRGHCDRACFVDQGIEVEDLDPESGNLLGVIDRFLSLARHVPGAIAIHGGPDGPGVAGSLVAALLMRQYGFGGREAVAWVGMAHSPALSVGQQATLAGKSGWMRVRSEPSLAGLVSAGDSDGGPEPGRAEGSGFPLVAAAALSGPLLGRSVSLQDLLKDESEGPGPSALSDS